MWLDYWSTSIDFARNSFDIVECRNALTCSYYVLWFYVLFVFSFLAMVFLACFLRFTYREKISFSYLGTPFHNLCEKFFNSFIATDTIFGLAVSSPSTLIGVKSDFSLMGAQCIWASWLQKGQWGSDIYIFRNKPGIVTDILESSCFHRYIFKNQVFSDFFFSKMFTKKIEFRILPKQVQHKLVDTWRLSQTVVRDSVNGTDHSYWSC